MLTVDENTLVICLVADVLGHSDINTTAKHYSASEDAHRRKAAKIDPYEQ